MDEYAKLTGYLKDALEVDRLLHENLQARIRNVIKEETMSDYLGCKFKEDALYIEIRQAMLTNRAWIKTLETELANTLMK